MLSRLYPGMYVDSILDIPLEVLRERQIKAFILDLDNTITDWNSVEIKEQVAEWFKQIRDQGFKACILSNNGEKRVLGVAKSLGIPYIHRARKPTRGAFRRAIDLMQISPEETAVIGDQIFTDILGGNRAGAFTILVKPLARKEFWGTKISRFFEFWVLRWLSKNGRLTIK